MANKSRRAPLFTRAQVLPGDDRYRIVDCSGRPGGGTADPLGTGAAGVVYRATYKDLGDRAIKFLSLGETPPDGLLITADELGKEFRREIATLARLTHTNIAKVLDTGVCTIDGLDYPYYVMDYVQGINLKSFLQACSGEDFFVVMSQVLDALAYLHSAGFYHLDIKEENIFVRNQEVQPTRARGRSSARSVQIWPRGPHAVLLDLGGAKPIPQYGANDATLTYYWTTEKAVRPGRPANKRVSHSQLLEWGPDLDLFSVGRILADAMTKPEFVDRIRAYSRDSGVRALRWLIDRLVEPAANGQHYYGSADQLIRDWNRLKPSYTWPLGLQELSLIPGDDSIQLGTVRVGLTRSLREIIAHPLFRRLMNLSQLEHVSLVYPDATHNRFSHSLLTFQFARLFLVQLLEHADFRMTATEQHIQATLLVALLHDIGHYPLSHAFEDFTAEALGPRRVLSVPEGARPLSDEALFQSFVDPAGTDPTAPAIFRFLTLARVGGKEIPSLRDTIQDRYPDAVPLMSMIMRGSGDEPAPIPTLRAIINSAVDVDKIAYLTSDSSATGLRFGQGMDVDGLLANLVPPHDREDGGVLGVREDGLPAVESVIAARFWMIARAYWHRWNRSAMAMHKFVIASLILGDGFSFQDYFARTLGYGHERGTRLLDRQYARWAVRVHGRDNFRRPLLGLTCWNPSLYWRLLTIANGPSDAEGYLRSAMLETDPLAAVELAESIRTCLNDQFHFGLVYGDVVVDIPQKGRDRVESTLKVHLDRDPDHPRELTDPRVAPLLRAAAEDFEANVKKCRVFVHPVFQDAVTAAGLREVQSVVFKLLTEKYSVPAGLARPPRAGA